MRLLIPLTLTIVLSGCFGVPEGGAQLGDTVAIDWIAYDPETGEVIREGSSQFAIGSGDSRLGKLLETSLIGHKVNDTYRFLSDDPSRSFEAFYKPPRFSEFPAVDQVPRNSFEASFGPTVVGDEHDLGNGVMVVVESLSTQGSTELVHFRYVLNGTVELPDPNYPGKQIVTARGDNLILEYVPILDTTFLLGERQTGPFFGMPPGMYKAVGADGDLLVYRRANVVDPALAEVPIEFEVTVRALLAAEPVATPDGAYGARDSPMLLS